MKDNKREYWIDVMRAFACIMVLFTHAPQYYSGQSGQWLMAIINYFGMAWGPILFFMISGACIMNHEQSVVPFFKRRFSRIALPMVFWSIVYVFLQHYVWVAPASSESIVYQLLMIPIAPQYGLLWFMYVLIAIYLMTPILSSFIQNCSKRDFEIYLLLWGITLLLPWLSAFFGNRFDVMIQRTGSLFYLSGFLWVAVLGVYCRRYVRITRVKFWHYLLCIAIMMSPMYSYIVKRYTGSSHLSSLSLDSIATTAMAFIMIKTIGWREKGKAIVNAISKYSFGIYLTHMMFMEPFKIWIAQYNLHYAIQIPITAILAGLFGFVITFLIAKLPWGKYIVG